MLLSRQLGPANGSDFKVVVRTDQVAKAKGVVAEFSEGSRGSPCGKGETGRGTRAPHAISTPLQALQRIS